MNTTFGSFTGFLAVVSAAIILQCSLSSCGSTAPASCGDLQFLPLYKTLTPGDPVYRLATPMANGSSTCQVHFIFTFSYADPAKEAKAQTFQDIPLSDVAHAFHVNTDNIYFAQGSEWNAVHSGGAWTIDFYDHNNDASSAVFYISTSLTSQNPADSVRIQGEIRYYNP